MQVLSTTQQPSKMSSYKQSLKGLADKYSDLRRELKALLGNSDYSDETIVRHVMRITSEESERQKRIGLPHRQPTTAHSAEQELSAAQEYNTKKVSSSAKIKTNPVKELAAKIDELTKMIEAMK